jgi:hypothetical protein
MTEDWKPDTGNWERVPGRQPTILNQMLTILKHVLQSSARGRGTARNTSTGLDS